ncbi:MAG: biopolymer transporter ExbD [Polyangiales bacterium]
MPVSKPGKMPFKPGPFGRPVANKPVLYHQLPLLTVQRRLRGGGHKGVNADLNLTSMIDYLVITVVFLLSQFGTQQQMQSSANLEVPTIPHADNLISAPIISISEQAILMDGQRVANPPEVRTVERIDRLFERLDQAKREYPVLHPGETFQGDIVFQIDRRTPWSIIKAVARTCSQAGYTRLNFAVTKGRAAATN